MTFGKGTEDMERSDSCRSEQGNSVDHDTIVEEWLRIAQKHDDENYEFLRSLKFREYGYDPDELAVNCTIKLFD